VSQSQFVDPRVSRAKFDREIAEYHDLGSDYRRRGWLLVRAEFPWILVVLAAPQLKPPAIVTGVAFDYTNYDMRPPSVRLVDPFTGNPYKAKELPTHLKRSVESAGPPIPGLQLPLGTDRTTRHFCASLVCGSTTIILAIPVTPGSSTAALVRAVLSGSLRRLRSTGCSRSLITRSHYSRASQGLFNATCRHDAGRCRTVSGTRGYRAAN
jgi:ABC-type dipeptide/oligopeptide/nickel transport system permease subunit